MTFGGAPCPSEWGNASESITDLANILFADPEWDPEEIQSPIQHMVTPDEPDLPDDVPFGEALSMVVDP